MSDIENKTVTAPAEEAQPLDAAKGEEIGKDSMDFILKSNYGEYIEKAKGKFVDVVGDVKENAGEYFEKAKDKFDDLKDVALTVVKSNSVFKIASYYHNYLQKEIEFCAVMVVRPHSYLYCTPKIKFLQ